jgi:SAM-dependent methyltransferase
MVNTYSHLWFELFLETRPYTEQETAFVMRNLPNPPYRRLLDLCCGQGRHANPLARRGYAVTGIDLDGEALASARQHAPEGATYLQSDMRHVSALPGHFDAIISLWQSFGYFDEATNRDLLGQLARKLEPGGRLILDIYHRKYWEARQGSLEVERRGIAINVTNTVRGNRLRSRLQYGDGLGSDTFEWQLYTPEEIEELAASHALRTLLVCTECAEHQPATPDKPAMQLVFERRS